LNGFLIRSIHILFPLVLLIAGVFLRVEEPRWFQQWQMWVFDSLNVLHPRPYDPGIGVRIVDIDDATLEKVGQWPWPRTKIAELIYRLKQAGAAVVAFDIVFSESDRTSPKNIVELWPQVPEFKAVRDQVREMPDHDEQLAQFIKQLGGVVTGFALTNAGAPRTPTQKGNFAISGPDARVYLQSFPGAVANLTVLSEAADGNGNFNMLPESDGIVRRVPLLVSFKVDDKLENNLLFPALSVEALRVAQNAKTMVIKTAGGSGELSLGGARTGLVKIKIGQFIVPTDAQGRVWVHYSGHREERYISAGKVFDQKVDKSLLEGHVVLVGTSAAGLGDLRSSPLDKVLPGVEVHAEVIEQIFQKNFLKRPDYALAIEASYIVGVGLLLIVLLPYLGALWCAAIGATTVAASFGGSWYAYVETQQLIDPIYPSVAVLAVYLSGSLISYARTEAEKRQVRSAFAQYLSPALVEQLAAEPDRLQLGGETREMTFLFCDVRGFTTISETFKSNPHGLTKLINRLLTPLTNVILDNRGTIDKYMGDCIMAFWNAPLDDETHAADACESAMRMYVALEKLNKERELEAEEAGETFLPLNVGIGINTGECVVGNMGSDQRFDYSVLGDPVNLAARLEGQSKNYGVGVVLGSETVNQINGNYATLELDLIAVKGKTEAVDIYCLYGDAARAKSPEFLDHKSSHDEMLKVFRQQAWDKAEDLIRECRKMANGELDEFYDLYDERIAEYRETPPPTDWDGVFVATTK
jgi:adenylate cyclase